MTAAPPQKSLFHRTCADELQDFLLIRLAVDIGRQMDQPEKQIVEIYVDAFPPDALGLHPGEKGLYLPLYSVMIAQFNGFDQRIQLPLAENVFFLMGLQLMLIEIYVLLAPERLKISERCRRLIGLGYHFDVRNLFSHKQTDLPLERDANVTVYHLYILYFRKIPFLGHVVAIYKSGSIIETAVRYLQNTVAGVLLEDLAAVAVYLLAERMHVCFLLIELPDVGNFYLNIPDSGGQMHIGADVCNVGFRASAI